MKLIFASILIICLTAPFKAFSEDTIIESYPYATLGIGPIPILPNFGLGYRTRFSQIGWDSSVEYSTTFGQGPDYHQFSCHSVGLYYLDPCKKDSYYLGCGALGGVMSFTWCYREHLWYCSPDFVFGKQFGESKRQFIELHINAPAAILGREKLTFFKFPLVQIKYGVSF